MAQPNDQQKEAEKHITDELANQANRKLVARSKTSRRKGGLRPKRNCETPNNLAGRRASSSKGIRRSRSLPAALEPISLRCANVSYQSREPMVHWCNRPFPCPIS